MYVPISFLRREDTPEYSVHKINFTDFSYTSLLFRFHVANLTLAFGFSSLQYK